MEKKEKEFIKWMLSNIDISLRSDLNSTKMGKECYRSNTDIDVSEYCNYSYEEVIQLYKINRLSEIGVITDTEYANLIDLFKMKRLLHNKLTLQFAEDSYNLSLLDEDNKEELISPKARLIIDEIRKIEDRFALYHLNVSDFELKSLIDLAIQSEDYSKCDIIALEVFTRTMKRNNE